MEILISNSQDGLLFHSCLKYTNKEIVLSSIFATVQSISKSLFQRNNSKPFKTFYKFENKHVKIFSTLKNNFIFIDDRNINDDIFDSVFCLFCETVSLDPFFNENVFIKEGYFLDEIKKIIRLGRTINF